MVQVEGSGAKGDGRSAVASELKSVDDLILIEYTDPSTNIHHKTFLWVTEDDEVFFGRATTSGEMSLQDYTDALQRVPDEDLFPKLPADSSIATADDDLGTCFCKRPGLYQFEPGRNTGTPKVVLDEALIMETLAKNPHPNIIRYRGCRIRRGRITGILLDSHELTLDQFALVTDWAGFDSDKFLAAVESAIDHLHGLGLAHNDLNPSNIMMGDGDAPVLIDFGSCQPFGARLQTFGTPGWFEEDFWTSEKKHDTYSLRKLRQWVEEKTAKPVKSEL